MKLKINTKVNKVIKSYPKAAQHYFLRVRKLILETAAEIEDLETLEETMKWGEPSYLTKHGCTVRMD